MTMPHLMPHLMNRPHLADGWCLDCVVAQHSEIERLRTVLTDAYKVLDGNAVLLRGRSALTPLAADTATSRRATAQCWKRPGRST
jgi:hypothetical protein